MPANAATSGPLDITSPPPCRIQGKNTGKVERPHDQRRHDHGVDQDAHRQPGTKHALLAQQTRPQQRRLRPRFDPQEEHGSNDGREQQRAVDDAEAPIPKRHRQRIGRERHRQDDYASLVERRARISGRTASGRQAKQRQEQRHHRERELDQEDRLPAAKLDEQAAQRRPQRRAHRGQGAQQAHGAAGARLGYGLAHQRHGERHHDRRPHALQRARRDQPPQAGRRAAQYGGHGKHGKADEQQSTPADDVAQAADADDRASNGEEVGQHHPLDRLEGCIEGLCQRWQSHVGDAGAQRGQQHGQRQARHRPARGSIPRRVCANRMIKLAHGNLQPRTRQSMATRGPSSVPTIRSTVCAFSMTSSCPTAVTTCSAV